MTNLQSPIIPKSYYVLRSYDRENNWGFLERESENIERLTDFPQRQWHNTTRCSSTTTAQHDFPQQGRHGFEWGWHDLERRCTLQTFQNDLLKRHSFE